MLMMCASRSISTLPLCLRASTAHPPCGMRRRKCVRVSRCINCTRNMRLRCNVRRTTCTVQDRRSILEIAAGTGGSIVL
jgi:hypothetical protein